MPAGARLVLLAAGVCLVVAMLVVGSGLATRIAASVGSTVGGVMSRVTAMNAAPSAAAVALDTPLLDAPPAGGYTNKPTVALSGRIPVSIVGHAGFSVVIYRIAAPAAAGSRAVQTTPLRSGATAGPAAARTEANGRERVAELAVGGTVGFAVPSVPLKPGGNDFAATLVGPKGESSESPVVHYFLDTTAPKITITSPRNYSLLSTASVAINGKSEAAASVVAHGDRAAGGDTATAAADGTFRLDLPLLPGSNVLTITATDLAGNQATVQLTVQRSFGRLAVVVTASPRVINSKTASTPVSLTARVTSSAGGPLAGARVVFLLTVPGLPAIASPEVLTDAAGLASWSTTVTGATKGNGLAAASATSQTDGTINGQTTIQVK